MLDFACALAFASMFFAPCMLALTVCNGRDRAPLIIVTPGSALD